MTYSIVGYDQDTGQLGYASQSHFFGVGSLVGRAEAGVGVAVSQAFANIDWPHFALEKLRGGLPPGAVISELIAGDPLSDYRQVLVMDSTGAVSHYTGVRCVPAAGVAFGDQVVAAGNMLVTGEVVDAMISGAEPESSSASLGSRLLGALAAGEKAGGDARGSQSACLVVVSGEISATPWRQEVINIRVDDHPRPVGELERLLRMQESFAVIGQVLFNPPLVIGHSAIGKADAQAAVDALAEVGPRLGDNREADLWRAVVLVRSGRTTEGRRLMDELTEINPDLSGLFAGLAEVGILR